MNPLIKLWHTSYFTEPAASIAAIITLIISLSKIKSCPAFKLITLYLTSFICLYLFDYVRIYWNLQPYLVLFKVSRVLDSIVTLIEFTTFSYYIHSGIKTKKYKKIVEKFSF